MNPRLLYDNFLTGATITSSTIASGYSNQNVIDGRPYTFAKFNAAGTNYIQGQFGAGVAVNCIGICGHNLKTVSASIAVKYSNNGSSWTTATGGTLTPLNDDAILLCFTAATATYWKVEISNAAGQPQIGVLFVGSYLEMPFPPDPAPVPYTENINAETFESETGNILGSSVKDNPIEIAHQFRLLTRTWVDTYFKPFWDGYGKALKPFFYAWDLTNAPNDVFYCTLKSSAKWATPVSTLNYYDSLTIEAKAQK